MQAYVKESDMHPISDVMTRDVRVVRPDADLLEAARLMRDLDVGALPVCDGRRLMGMITDRDITVRATARGLAPADCKVADVMTKEVSWCFADQRVGEVLKQMSGEQVRRIPVIDRANMELVGMVSLGDLATRQDNPVQKTLEDVSRATPSLSKMMGKQPGR
jgi:CBS domain-containing protein